MQSQLQNDPLGYLQDVGIIEVDGNHRSIRPDRAKLTNVLKKWEKPELLDLAVGAIVDLLDAINEYLDAHSDGEANARRVNAMKGGLARKAKSPKTAAMALIEQEYLRILRREVPHKRAAKFAKDIFPRFSHVITNEDSIENACTRWKRAFKKSSS